MLIDTAYVNKRIYMNRNLLSVSLFLMDWASRSIEGKQKGDEENVLRRSSKDALAEANE
jgi:hypothetical protein